MQWLESWKDHLSHFHIHNNDGSWDTHNALDDGNIPMREFLNRAAECCTDGTFTLELLEALADLKEDTCIITHGGVSAIIMETLFPNEGKNRYQWQPAPGMGYVVNGCYYNKLPADP